MVADSRHGSAHTLCDEIPPLPPTHLAALPHSFSQQQHHHHHHMPPPATSPPSLAPPTSTQFLNPPTQLAALPSTGVFRPTPPRARQLEHAPNMALYGGPNPYPYPPAYAQQNPHPPPLAHPPPSAKRNLESRSSSPTKRSRTSASSKWSDTTVNKLLEQYTNGCLMCGWSRYDRCHVVGSGDHRNFHQLCRLRRLNIDQLNSFDNAIPLCANHHAAFDDQYRPSLVIVPADLDFFRDAEIVWRGVGSNIRQSPTAELYFRHCQVKRLVPEDAKLADGGLYRGYMDQDLSGGGHPSTEFRWHGDPMAVIYKATAAATRIEEPELLPPSIYEQLLDLHALYRQGNKLHRTAVHASTNPPAGVRPLSNTASELHGGESQGSQMQPRPTFPPPSNQAKRGEASDQALHQHHHSSHLPTPTPSPSPDDKTTKRKRERSSDVEADVSSKRVRSGIILSDNALDSLPFEDVMQAYIRSLPDAPSDFRIMHELPSPDDTIGNDTAQPTPDSAGIQSHGAAMLTANDHIQTRRRLWSLVAD
ncbi:hypothetical protein EJ04DRAFT_110487 [Polyplosphaeria fusca]|uniref:HNH nuclease domain-containing protein n=1 Tax=Polyplosphaeria fusca TaxID=682080 RepID=A0A9P4UWN2_9PLEO|nr:hypothetical protein EJ04DRAFT_110487 [Polyplosphaeria fusca]